MRNVQVSDDPAVVMLTPERFRAARAVLNWTPSHLASRAMKALEMPLLASEITSFEDYGEMLDPKISSGILAVLLDKVWFTLDGAPGVVRKEHVQPPPGTRYVRFGTMNRRRRPPL